MNKTELIKEIMRIQPLEVKVHEPLHLNYLNNPMEYWEEVYEKNRYGPILVIGDRTTLKLDVALQICEHFDEDFEMERNVIFDSKNLADKVGRGGCTLIPSFPAPIMSLRSMKKGTNATLRNISNSRFFETRFVLTSNSLRSINYRILKQVRDVVLVQGYTSKNHIVEHIHFSPPSDPTKLTPPYPEFECKKEEVGYKKMLKATISYFITKYPFESMDRINNFKEIRKEYMREVDKK